MLIDSDFRDYYDSIARTVCDRSCVYKRKTVELNQSTTFQERYPTGDFHAFRYPRALVQGVLNKYTSIWPFVIGFCGRIYPAVYFTSDRYSLSALKGIVYSIEELDALVNSSNDHAIKRYFEDEQGHHYSAKAERRYVVKHFENHTEGTDLFEKHKIPIFFSGFTSWAMQSACTVSNLRLSTYGFQRIIDPYTAFQEIYMYMSGVLGVQDNKIPNVNNNDMIEAKGFDIKHSFRKPKS